MITVIEATHFGICVRNQGCEDLQLRKLYPILPDESAEREGFLRIIDESGEDYLYPRDHFLLVDLPSAVEETLVAMSS
jgi:hypothetical protein